MPKPASISSSLPASPQVNWRMSERLCATSSLIVNSIPRKSKLAAWIGGKGAVPLYNLMEDAATAEISRGQLWQWMHHELRCVDGTLITPDLVEGMLAEVLAHQLGHVRGDDGGHVHHLVAHASQGLADHALKLRPTHLI